MKAENKPQAGNLSMSCEHHIFLSEIKRARAVEANARVAKKQGSSFSASSSFSSERYCYDLTIMGAQHRRAQGSIDISRAASAKKVGYCRGTSSSLKAREARIKVVKMLGGM